MLAIINATLVMTDHLIPNASLVADDGKIIDFGKKIPIPEGAEIIDAKGLFVGPGLIDIHTHSDGISDFDKEPVSCSKTLIKHGITSVLPALYADMDTNKYIEALDKIRKAMESGACPNLAGVYMEGPYLSPKYGSGNSEEPWGYKTKREKYLPVLKAADGIAKVFCIAPELEGIMDFVEDTKNLFPDAVFSVAHSEATPDLIEEIMPYGLRLATHHTNAVGVLESFPECRGVCVEECVNYNDDIYAEIICDSMGIHVHPYLQRLLLKIKGKEKIILISDCFIDYGDPIPGCEDAFDISFDMEGGIGGARMTLDTACRNMMIHTGSSLCDIFRFASLNPAKVLGWKDLGKIKKGNRANLIICDHWFDVKTTIIDGKKIEL